MAQNVWYRPQTRSKKPKNVNLLCCMRKVRKSTTCLWLVMVSVAIPPKYKCISLGVSPIGVKIETSSSGVMLPSPSASKRSYACLNASGFFKFNLDFSSRPTFKHRTDDNTLAGWLSRASWEKLFIIFSIFLKIQFLWYVKNNFEFSETTCG